MSVLYFYYVSFFLSFSILNCRFVEIFCCLGTIGPKQKDKANVEIRQLEAEHCMKTKGKVETAGYGWVCYSLLSDYLH